uniref:Hematopoietic cell signal transducer n=1 Tax=Astatotilapia calliptera TaxID=8154 RepID=A0A3P8NAA3_ASTCA
MYQNSKNGYCNMNFILHIFGTCNIGQYSTVSCYRIEPGTIAGIICADVVLTLIIVVVTYRCASFRRQKIDNGKMTVKGTVYCKIRTLQ